MNKEQFDADTFKLGFIGGGLSSAVGQVHFSASRLDGKWVLSSGAFSRHEDINQKTAMQWHVPNNRLYPNWQSMIESEAENLDAVVVLTPTPDHADIVKQLIDSGVPIISEKALAVSLEEGYEIEEKLKQKNNFLAVTYNYSGYPMVRELRERIRKGELGNIQQIHFEMPQEGFVRPPDIAGKSAPPQSWRLRDTSIPMIAFDLGAHLNHLALFLTGNRPLRVFSDFSNYSEYENLVDNIMMYMDFENDMKGSFWMSKTTIGNRNGMKLRIYGDKGTAEWMQIYPEDLRMYYKDGTNITLDRGSKNFVAGSLRYNRMKAGHPSGFIEAFANLYTDISDALEEYKRTGKHSNPYVYGIDHSVSELKLFSAACESNQSRQWVDIK